MTRLPIQIIDDGLELCRELRGWLEQAGHIVSCSPPNRLTLATLAGSPPGLFLIGIANPRSEGLVFYQRLASHRQLRRVPIIAVSDDPDLEYELLDAYDFQSRPFDRKRLLASVGHLIEAAGMNRPPLLSQLAGEQLEPFRELLLERSGLHFSNSNQRLLERGLLHRMQALQITSPDKYLGVLARRTDNQDELNKLLGLLTIGETCFFRYRGHRDALIRHVLPDLMTRMSAQRRLRFWSAGCSTGEEPYSLAIALHEHFPQLLDWDVQILATDINKRSLRQAREGIYRARSLRQAEEHIRRRYFRQVGDHFVLDKQIRSMIRFGYLNLQADPFPQADNGTTDLDLVLCRNVLIYFQPETIRQIVARFNDCLQPGGYLFLGHAETLQGISDRFHRLHEHGAFFYQKKTREEQRSGLPASILAQGAPPVPAVIPEPPSPPTAVSAMPPPPPAVAIPRVTEPPPLPTEVSSPVSVDDDQLFTAAMAAFDREEFPVAEQLFDRLLETRPDHAQALVGKGLIRANQGLYQEARQWCARAIRHDDLCPEAYLLRGLILDMEEQLERALVEYQKVLWLDRDFVMAHYFSAKAHGRLGQPEQQARALRNAIRLLERQGDTGIIPYSSGLTQPVMLEVCLKELAGLNPAK
jgi:chemotaxis protein methyltransferase CheR